MKQYNRILWGIILIAAGVLFALNALNVTNVDVFFDGWWTLFIIVPCTVGLFTEQEKIGNLIGIAIGVGLLLCCQNVLSFSLLWKLFVPAVIVIIGLKMVFTGMFDQKTNALISQIKKEGKNARVCCAAFSGSDLKMDGEVFEGAELTAVFGGVECDLRNAIIEKDCVIQAYAIFGGIDVLVPEHVNVRVSSTSLFGGISNKAARNNADKTLPTLYIKGICLFGGVDIK